MTAEDFALRSGIQLGHYRIIKILGRGGFGLTYQAWDDNLNRLVAIKEYFPHGQATRDADLRTVLVNTSDVLSYRKGLERFLDEARTLAQFRDPRIVHVHGFQEANNTAYMVMDFEDGISLRDYVLQNGMLSPGEARRILADILLALQVLHVRNYLHRDIKPANIMRRPDGSILLLDFGSARITHNSQEQAFTVIVTPGYAPMEQYTATETQGPATDLYAVGACLLFCLTCASPIDAMKRMIAEQASERDPLEPVFSDLVQRDPGYGEIADILRWLLQGRASLRPQSAGAVIQRLGLTSPALPTPTPLLDPGMNTVVLTPAPVPAPALRPGLPAPVDLTVMRSIPSKLVEPLRQQLQATVGERATQILFQSIRSARNAQHLIENISAQLLHEPRREQAIQSITQLLAEASRVITVEVQPITAAGARETPSAPMRSMPLIKDEETTQLLSGELAKFIGPIAKMLVKKRLAKAASIQELINQLEEEIAVAADRAAFRKAVIKLKIIPA